MNWKNILSQLESGELRSAEKKDGQWVTNETLKKAFVVSKKVSSLNWVPL